MTIKDGKVVVETDELRFEHQMASRRPPHSLAAQSNDSRWERIAKFVLRLLTREQRGRVVAALVVIAAVALAVIAVVNAPHIPWLRDGLGIQVPKADPRERPQRHRQERRDAAGEPP